MQQQVTSSMDGRGGRGHQINLHELPISPDYFFCDFVNWRGAEGGDGQQASYKGHLQKSFRNNLEIENLEIEMHSHEAGLQNALFLKMLLVSSLRS